MAVLRTVTGRAFDIHLVNQSRRLVDQVRRVHKGHTVTNIKMTLTYNDIMTKFFMTKQHIETKILAQHSQRVIPPT